MRGERIREMRRKMGLSQEDLARQIGIRGQQVYRYEAGENDPSADILRNIAQILGVTTDYLVGLSDDPTRQIREDDLTPMELKLINAFRRGDIVELSETFTARIKELDKPPVPTNKPAVNG